MLGGGGGNELAKGLGIPPSSIVVPPGLGPNLQFNAINFDDSVHPQRLPI